MLILWIQLCKKANVTHPELGVTLQLPIISVKKVCWVKSKGCDIEINSYKESSEPSVHAIGVLTKGTIIEVNSSCP